MIKKILILSANPADTDRLRLDKEVSEIKEGLRRAKHRDLFDIQSEWAVSFNSLRRALLDHEPQIVHFSGHGGEEGLMMEGDMGFAESIPSEALAALFELCSNHVECVILNACYSAPQAAAINKHINYVIGMPGKINDRAAIEFSVGFYDALGAGRSMEDAFKFGIIGFQQVSPGLSKKSLPILNKKNGNEPCSMHPESSTLERLLKEGLKNLDLEEYNAALEKFKEARQLIPENGKAQALYCLSFLSRKPMLSIDKSKMNEISAILKKVVQGKDQNSANLARILLGIIWFDYYIKVDHHYQELFFEENAGYLRNYQPSYDEKQLISHIPCSDSAKTIFKIR